MPESLVEIGEYAFANCIRLVNISIPDGVTSIGEGAFALCTKLSSVTLPENLTAISFQTFDGCTSLTSVYIPSSVSFIECEAFYNCTSLKDAVFEDADGWNVTSWYDGSVVAISPNELENPELAATYLKITYTEYDWRKN